MTAPVTSPTTQARAELTRLARMALSFEHADVETDLAALSRLDPIERDEAFTELVEALWIRDRAERGDVHWSEVKPDAEGSDRDGQALDAARTHVDLALDRLLGGG